MKIKFLLLLVLPLISLSCMGNTNTFKVFQTTAPAPLSVDSHFNVAIGTAGTGYTITYSRTQMKIEWEAYIGLGAPNLDSNSFLIILDAGTGLYYLTATSVNGYSRSAILLELDNGVFYVAPKGTCTCTSPCCRLGCSPKWSETLGSWYCTDCNTPLLCLDCGKTETSGYSPIFNNNY